MANSAQAWAWSSSKKEVMLLVVNNDNHKRLQFLLTLHEMAGGNLYQGVLDNELAEKLNMETTEFRRHAVYLKEEELVKFQTFGSIAITHRGRKEVERIMAERYVERERRVLQRHYDDRHAARNERGFSPDELARELNLDFHEVCEMVLGLTTAGLLAGTDEVSWISPLGIKEIERVPDTPISPNIVHFHGPNTGPVQIGSNQTQNNYYNQALTEVLPKLAEMISAVKAQNFDDKDEVLADLEKVHALASGDVNEGVWKRIQTRLTAAKTTMEITGLAYKSLPYWPLIWDHFMK
jgi:hypothetical protein